MLPNSNTLTRPNRPMVRWLVIAGGALLALIVTFTCGIVVAGALAPAAALPAAAHTQPVPATDPTPAAAPVRAAPVDDPYYSNVAGELLRLTDDLTALMTHGAQIGKQAQKADPAAWTAEWEAKAAQVTTQADSIIALSAPAGAERIQEEAAKAASSAAVAVRHIRAARDAALGGDVARVRSENQAILAAVDIHQQSGLRAAALLDLRKVD